MNIWIFFNFGGVFHGVFFQFLSDDLLFSHVPLLRVVALFSGIVSSSLWYIWCVTDIPAVSLCVFSDRNRASDPASDDDIYGDDVQNRPLSGKSSRPFQAPARRGMFFFSLFLFDFVIRR